MGVWRIQSTLFQEYHSSNISIHLIQPRISNISDVLVVAYIFLLDQFYVLHMILVVEQVFQI